MGTSNSLSTEVFQLAVTPLTADVAYYYIDSSGTKHRRLSVAKATANVTDLITKLTLSRRDAPVGGSATAQTLRNVRDADDARTVSRSVTGGLPTFTTEEVFDSKTLFLGNDFSMNGGLLRAGSSDYLVLKVERVSGGPGGSRYLYLTLEEI